MNRTLRRDVVAGPHPDDADTWLVFCTRTGHHFELPAHGWRIAEAFDGTRTVEEVAAMASDLAGAEVAEEAVPKFVEQLDALGLFEHDAGPPPPRLPEDGGPQWTVRRDTPEAPRLSVHPAARYSCHAAGTCCASGYVISLDEEEVRRLREVSLPIVTEDPVCLLPRSPGAPWVWALSNDPSCPFLEDHRCGIHATEALPSTCRVYPLAFVEHQGIVHASVTHRCVCGTLDRGALLTDQMPSLKEKLRAARLLPTLPEVSRVDAYTRVETPAAVDALLAAADESDPWEMLRTATRSIREQSVEVDVGGELAEPARMLASLGDLLHDESDLTLACALKRRRHPNHRLIEQSLKRADLFEPAADPRAEVARFLRDYLGGLRLYRFTTLADGLYAAVLATWAILDGAPDHPRTRERIMLWEDALLSPLLRAMLGRDGPAAAVTASMANVERQLAGR